MDATPNFIMRTVTIHHFDDEPNNAPAILRDTIPSRIAKHNPNWIMSSNWENDENIEETPLYIELSMPSGLLLLRYVVYASTERFLSNANILHNDIVILDGYEDDHNGRLILRAKECLNKARIILSPDRIIMISAYLSFIPDDMRDNVSKLIAKPINASSTTIALLKLSGVYLDEQ